MRYITLRQLQESPFHPGRSMDVSKFKRRSRSLISCGLLKAILHWLILVNVYSADALSELRYQRTDTSLNTTIVGIRHLWGAYGPWTACSSTCGGYGIQSQDRPCLNERNEFIDERYCEGIGRRYKVCRTYGAQCPSSAAFRTQRCKEHNEFGLDWKPYLSPYVGACQIECFSQTRTGHNFTVLDQFMPDGTFCSNYGNCDWGNNGKGVCLQGQCVSVGCDGLVNSLTAFDSCGVCGGDESTCRVISDSITEILQVGYTDLVQIPAGAFNIRVYYMQLSKVHLAIQDEFEKYALNGGLIIANPGRFEVSGATAVYRRCKPARYRHEPDMGHLEEVYIQGTIQFKIIILLASEKGYSEAQVAYQYSLPLLRQGKTVNATNPSPTVLDLRPDTTTSSPKNFDDAQGVTNPSQKLEDVQNAYDGKRQPHKETDSPDDFVTQGTANHGQSSRQDNGTSDSKHKIDNSSLPSTAMSSSFESSASTETAQSKNTSQHADENRNRLVPKDMLSGNQTSSLPQQKPSVFPNDFDALSNSSKSQFHEVGNKNNTTNQRKGHISEISSFPEDDLESSIDYFVSDSFYSAATSLDPEEQMHSTTPSHVTSSSLASGQNVETSTSSPLTALNDKRTLATESLQDFTVEGEDSGLLFGGIVQFMEFVKPSSQTQEGTVAPLIAAMTSALTTSGDVITAEQEIRPHYLWARTGLAPCSATCSRGMSRSYAYCTLSGEQVPDRLCDPASKPRVVEKECGGKACKPRWAVGSWSQCTVSCGTGFIYRTVHCWLMIGQGLDTSISNSYCNQSIIPDSVRACSQNACGPQWQTSDWSECSVQCGEGLQTREVRCSSEDETCSLDSRPRATKPCEVQSCSNQWVSFQWTKCHTPCTVQYRRVNCIDQARVRVSQDACPGNDKPLSHRLCGKACPAQWIAQSWGQCRGECRSAIQHRKVICAATTGVSGRMQVLADTVCDESQKPPIERRCNLAHCRRPTSTLRKSHGPRWLTTPWSVCSVTCGKGQQTREIACNRKSNQPHLDCDERKKPSSTESCNMDECPTVNPVCSDSPSTNCNVIRQANLCRYNSYKRQCCLTCSP